MIHCFHGGQLNLVLDVNSGALHHVDDAAFDVLTKMQNACKDTYMQVLEDAPSDIQSEVRLLIGAGQLFSKEKTNVHSYMENRNPVVKALCLHIAHECNLRCAYCFAGQGNYGDRGLMTPEIGKKALDFLIENSGSRRNLEVDFFGGEPMLNFGTVKEIVAYGREREAAEGKNFRFTLTTNGTFLSRENIEYINENFDNVVLSIDGRKHVNDKIRTIHGGGGSYDKILPKIKALADARNHENYYVRGTYTRHNLDFSADVLHLADLGFKNISIEPVVAPPSEDYAIREEDLPALFDEYDKLAEELLRREKSGQGVHFFHFEMDITGGPCIAKRVTGCGAGSEYLAVTPSGKLFPCHQFVGDEKFQVGDLDVGIIGNELTREFATCHVYTKPECAKCWAKFYCSGGCIATAHYANGSILNPDKISCELMRKRIECALGSFSLKM
ncbi:MAG: thioether cross-link-forming SCIFF peptide maturase [Defluviitaleaceae bacterium]|nr:thioether cross-link-forming SCIFF peptide maturase [Defluviitaleaceae bacterium]